MVETRVRKLNIVVSFFNISDNSGLVQGYLNTQGINDLIKAKRTILTKYIMYIGKGNS